ncbi:MAG: hypothetical protein JNL74_07285 [Fibrobacteres bacterium]|nr:hypothetical protein [Fibrobacterota bacterium]
MSTFFPSRQPHLDKKWHFILEDGRCVTVLARTLKSAREIAVQCYRAKVKRRAKKDGNK